MKKYIIISILVATFGVVGVAQGALKDADKEQVNGALKELSAKLGVEVSTPAKAKELCDKEENFSTCVEIGKKYQLYSEERVEKVDLVLKKHNQDKGSRSLEEALKNLEIQCGDNTVKGCGDYCLNPPAGAINSSDDVPGVCISIAARFFGPDGVLRLREARKKVLKTRDEYLNPPVLTTPDGKTISGKDDIKNLCSDAFRLKDLETAKACGKFAVDNGFAEQDKVEKGIKLLETFKEKSGEVAFDRCEKNPKECENFIPKERLEEFRAGQQVKHIIQDSIGFDPEACRAVKDDKEVSQKCFEGLKNAIPDLEKLAGTSPDAAKMVKDLKDRLNDKVLFENKKEAIHEEILTKGGPGGCKSEEECRKYCFVPENAEVCKAYGVRKQIFIETDTKTREEKIQRFENSTKSERDLEHLKRLEEIRKKEINRDFSPKEKCQEGQFWFIAPSGEGYCKFAEMKREQIRDESGKEFRRTPLATPRATHEFQKTPLPTVDQGQFEKTDTNRSLILSLNAMSCRYSEGVWSDGACYMKLAQKNKSNFSSLYEATVKNFFR